MSFRSAWGLPEKVGKRCPICGLHSTGGRRHYYHARKDHGPLIAAKAAAAREAEALAWLRRRRLRRLEASLESLA